MSPPHSKLCHLHQEATIQLLYNQPPMVLAQIKLNEKYQMWKKQSHKTRLSQRLILYLL